jgi:hypothetical protein
MHILTRLMGIFVLVRSAYLVSAKERVFAVAVASMMLCGCVPFNSPNHAIVTLPASAGWYAGERVYYITTEITDPTMARNSGITYAPRLTDAIPEYPKLPSTRSVLERVYKFPNGEQDAVFASAPTPPGPKSSDEAYSPLWLAYMVRWKAPAHIRPLKSEEAILAAADGNELSIERTSIVINCPIVSTASGGVLPHSKVTP